MHLNADFSKAVVIDTNAMPWETSPMAGVSRHKLDRIGEDEPKGAAQHQYTPYMR